MLRALNKPEYLYRPAQILRRIRFGLGAKRPELVVLPWGARIKVRGDDIIGRSISTYGVYDLVVTETIVRLLDAGEMALDVGANIGYMSCVMAKRTGPRGQVFSFEPSSAVFRDLQENVRMWSGPSMAAIQPQQCAVTTNTGTAELHLPVELADNRGVATLEAVPNEPRQTETVKTVSLDDWTPAGTQIGLMKIDVEGHEHSVLQGAVKLLSTGRVRDIVFEEHNRYPTPVQSELLRCGYHLYRLSRSLRKPLLLPGDDSRAWFEHPIGVLPNYLATRDASRAEQRFAKPGWISLKEF